MKITILCENQVSHRGAKICQAEWGFSVFIERGKTSVLLDSGHSGIFKSNAEKLGVNLEETDFIVLSHFHWDHVEGLLKHDFKKRKKLIMHPAVLEKIPSEYNDKFSKDFEVAAFIKPFEMAPGIFFLGEIPRVTSFEKGVYKELPMEDDSAIAVKTEKGVAVISGCSHSGICNICEYAKKVTGQKLYAVLGGFHLSHDEPEAVSGTIGYFKNEKPDFLSPMHCVDFSTLAKFYAELGTEKHSTGDVIELCD